MKFIPLTQGKFAMVDDEDFEWLSKYKWYLRKDGYAATNSNPLGIRRNKHNTSKGVYILMHRLILKPEGGQKVDHVSGYTLDN